MMKVILAVIPDVEVIVVEIDRNNGSQSDFTKRYGNLVKGRELGYYLSVIAEYFYLLVS